MGHCLTYILGVPFDKLAELHTIKKRTRSLRVALLFLPPLNDRFIFDNVGPPNASRERRYAVADNAGDKGCVDQCTVLRRISIS